MNIGFSRRKDKPTMHSSEALVKHYVAYSAKFLGITPVEQPKGTDVVRVAVRKLKFQRHIKKSEGEKIPKVELQISIYGVKILDPKTKDVQHSCQLHRMSFCADDKTDKRIFAYICTEPDTKRHLCYVFDSEKCAEEITIAIGQAFDLAYKMFLQSGGKDVESRKQIGNLQKKIQDLEMENLKLKKQLQCLEDQLISAQSSPLLHVNSSTEACMSSALSCFTDDASSLSSLEISSVTLTPLSSPDFSQSAGLLTPPPAKPAQFLPTDVFIVPRPRAGSIPVKATSTDVFDMVPFTPGSSTSRIQTCNGNRNFPSLPPVDRGTDLFGAVPFDPFTCGLTDYPPDVQSKLDEMQVDFHYAQLNKIYITELPLTSHRTFVMEGFKMGLTLEGAIFSLDQVDSRC
ncbi:PTB domain-containing engulfment adapter protein 1 isoform X1 [Ictalurus punctatus]|uniref:PTB domain-containing engulfment adapter protein 1 n=1 Tax=Ictalurus punctatus TaxID=7998 RepID=A0A2D0S069_ICTPU|nr:PTB domain-containing engulfment adapter protein 1 isoform X1 [Ictalurus punctatus]